MAAFNTFLNGADSLSVLRDQLENTSGELKRMQEERLDTVEGSVKLLTSAWEGLVLSFSNSKGIIKSVINLITEGVNGLNTLMNPDSQVSSLKNQFIETLMNTHQKGGQNAYDEQVASGAGYWSEKYISAKDTYQKSGGLIGAGEYEHARVLWEAFKQAVGETDNRITQTTIEDAERRAKDTEDARAKAVVEKASKIKAAEEAAKIAQVAQEKAVLFFAHDQKCTDITAAGTDARVKILSDATEQELEEYAKVPGKAAEMERQITENKRLEVEKRLKLSKKETEQSVERAINQYDANESQADVTVGKSGRKRNVASLQNEVQLHKDQAQAYQKELNDILAGGDEAIEDHKARYDELIKLIGQEQNAAMNLGKGKTAGGERKGFWQQLTEMSDEEVEQIKQQAFDLASQLSDAIFNAKQQASQRQLNAEKKAIDAQYKTESKLLDSKRDKGLISEKQYQKALEKIEADKAAKEEAAEKAAFEREKKLNIKQAIMNTALGVAKALAMYAWPWCLIPAAFTVAQGAIQVAAISSQKYEQGGLIPLGDGVGVVKGRSHAQGGHRIYLDGRPIGEIEGDELLAIVNKHDTARIGALSAANSIHGRKFARGGLISPGGYMTSSVGAPAGFAAAQGQSRAELYKQQEADRQQRDITTQLLLDNIEAINRRIDTLKVVVVAQDVTDTQDNIKKIKVKSSW